jgi:hypothetical protein
MHYVLCYLNCIHINICISTILLHIYDITRHSGDKIKNSETVGVCGTHGGQGRLWWGDQKEGYHLQDRGVDGRKILEWFYKKWNGEAWTGLIYLRIDIGSGRL